MGVLESLCHPPLGSNTDRSWEIGAESVKRRPLEINTHLPEAKNPEVVNRGLFIGHQNSEFEINTTHLHHSTFAFSFLPRSTCLPHLFSQLLHTT